MTDQTAAEHVDLDNTIAVIAKAMELSGTETVGELATFCRTRATSPRRLVEEAQRAEDAVGANDHHVSLLLPGTDLVVAVRPWDRQHDCIALVFDGVNDSRTPALLPSEARELAAALKDAAESIERGHQPRR